MRLILNFAPLLILAACSQPAPRSEEAETAAANGQAAEPEATPVPSMEGQWRVSQINGSDPVQVWPMIATVTSDRFAIQSECRQIAYEFSQDRNVVSFAPASGSDCPRVRSPAEIMIDRVLPLANIAIFSNEGREVQLSGAGGNVTLVRA